MSRNDTYDYVHGLVVSEEKVAGDASYLELDELRVLLGTKQASVRHPVTYGITHAILRGDAEGARKAKRHLAHPWDVETMEDYIENHSKKAGVLDVLRKKVVPVATRQAAAAAGHAPGSIAQLGAIAGAGARAQRGPTGFLSHMAGSRQYDRLIEALVAQKVAGVVTYEGFVNNGDPRAPTWPRAALGVDSAGRQATPEEIRKQMSRTASPAVHPMSTGAPFSLKTAVGNKAKVSGVAMQMPAFLRSALQPEFGRP